MRNVLQKLFYLPRVVGVLLAASALSAQASSVSLSFTNRPVGTITNGTPVPLSVIATTSGAPVILSCTLNFRTLAPLCTNTWNAMVLTTNASPTNFVATIPRLPAGNVEYFASCIYGDGGVTNTTNTSTYTNTVGTALDTSRNQDFAGSGWTGTTSPYNLYNAGTGWTGTQVRILTQTPFTNGLRFEATNVAFICSPVCTGGIGKVSFAMGMRNIATTGTIAVAYSTNGVDWPVVLTTTSTSTTVSFPVAVIGCNDPCQVKLYRPVVVGGSNSQIFVDNMVIAPPSADLQISVPTNGVTPLNPESFNPVTIRCNLQDTSTNEPTINRRVTLYYTWVSTNGAATNTSSLMMTNTPGLPDEYSTVVTNLDAGTNRYYFRCDFDGYYYTNVDKCGPYFFSNAGQTSTNTIPTNKFSYIINHQNVRMIRLQPTVMAFGLCATNDVRTNTLSICNDGNALLYVTNVVITGSVFSNAFTTNFYVAVNGTQNVNVVFRPTALQSYTEKITVLSDKTAGTPTNTVTGTGMPVESVSPPTVTGASSGTLSQPLSFSASGASDSWAGYYVQYRFDSSDGWTSGWSVATLAAAATTNHAWSNLGTYQVRAQARSATNLNVLSSWSATIPVTITNTAQINLLGNLNFGMVGIGQTSNLFLTITNSGPGALTVTNITLSNSVFLVVSATNFVLLPYTATNVTLRFAPLTPGSYTDLVVVASDATSGTNTLLVTGFCEGISTPVRTSGVLAGHVNELLSLSFLATSTLGHTVEYYYDWGDGAITNWTPNATVTHAWTSTNAWTMLVQARCQTHTNVLSMSITNLVNIYIPPLFAFSTVTNGSPFQVTMTATGAAPETVSNCVFYFIPPWSANAQPTNMTKVVPSTNDWTAMIPPLNPGSMQYYLQYMRSGVLLRFPVVTNNYLLITNALSPTRWESFNSGWTNSTSAPYNNWNPSTGWTGTQVRLLNRTPPLNNGGSSLRLENTAGASVVSPLLPAGIGTIYYEVGTRFGGVGLSTYIIAQISIDNGTNWIDILTNTLLTTGSLLDLHPFITLNLRVPARFRIYQPSPCVSPQNIFLDNIIISPPPTDVRITETLMNPGYPNSKDPVRVRCWTSDFTNLSTGATDAPSVNRRLSVIYRHETDTPGVWFTTNMYATGSSSYEGVIPKYAPGEVLYYIKCDFDGYFYTNSISTNTSTVSVNYPSENISPSYLPDQRPGPWYATYPVPTRQYDTLPDIMKYTIRLFRSAHDKMFLTLVGVNGNTNAPAIDNLDTITNMALVADYQWQGQTPMQGVTNLTWYFMGTSPYTNDANAYGSNAWWGANSQEFPEPPIGGFADLSATNPWLVTITYNGLLIYRFTTDTRACVVKRAVYQNFDVWQARPNYFEASSGIAARDYLNDFTLWGTNFFRDGRVDAGDSRWKYENFINQSLASAWNSDWLGTTYWWNYVQGMGTSERGDINRALMLNNASLGRIYNTVDSLTEGIRKVTFRARLSQTNPCYCAFNRDGLYGITNSWTNAYRLTNTISVASMTPGYAYISTIFCYTQNVSGVPTFYELRLTQMTDSAMLLQLNRWNNGAYSGTIYQPGNIGGKLTDFSAATPLQVDMAWTNYISTNASLSAVQFSGSISRGETVLNSWYTNTCYDNSANRIVNGGAVGFACADAEMAISALGVYRGTNLAVSAFSETGFNSSSWWLGGSVPNNWTIVGGVLRHSVPTTPSYVALSTIRTGTSGDRGTEGEPGAPSWTNEQSFAVSSFNYTNYSITLNYWDMVYVKVACTSGNLPVVVDDLVIEPWRAYTRGMADSNWTAQATIGGVQFWDWTSTAQQAAWALTMNGPDDWTIFEGLIVKSNANISAQFDRSRANPDLWQGLWSPKLTNGLGSIAFSANLIGGSNSHFQVQKAYEANLNDWTVVDGGDFSITNSSRDVVSLYVPVLLAGATGRLRILQLSDGSSTDAVLNIDNLDVRDYPPSDTPWKAYNCLIARWQDASNTVGRSYTTPSVKSCYLNNSVTNDVFAPLTNDNAYIQTPVVETGIGEISFVYRSWTNSGTTTISIRGATNEATPPGQWAQLTNFTFSLNTYTNFQWEDAYYPQYKVMRIYQTTSTTLQADNVTGRLCIDNILMAEPNRVGFAIASVTLLPAQPLFTNLVGVSATVGRLQMNPQNIRVFLSYTFATNVWGYTNWWSRTPTTGVFTVELTNTNPADRTFTSAGTSFIPAKGIDQVVQYVVWGTNDNMHGEPFFQGSSTFVNPSWYYPVDKNVANAAQGWSPYYYVYSCPPGSVWVNEFNYPYYDYFGSYIELTGPANANIGNWQIELFSVDTEFHDFDRCVITNTFKFANVVNGWGFFVWGDATIPNVNQWFTNAPNSMPNRGAVRLTRSMGAWEDRVCWGDEFGQAGYRNAGFKEDLGPLHLYGAGSNSANFGWSQSGSYTPGAQNEGQTLINAPVILGFTYFYLTSIVGLHGSHNLSSNVVTLAQDTTTSVTYTADSWYKIATFNSTSNGVNPEGMSVYTQYLYNIAADVSNNVSFVEKSPGEVVSGVPSSYGISNNLFEVWAIANSNAMQQGYMLGLAPTTNGTLTVSAINVSGTNLSVTVQLKTNSVAVDTTISGTLLVLESTNLTVGLGFVNAHRADLQYAQFTNGGKHVVTFPDAASNKFYKAQITLP